MRINREDFLRTLLQVQPSVSPREILEQSSCFIFKSGEVFGYNDEVSCRVKSGLDTKLTAAVQAVPLLNILGKLVEEEIETTIDDGHFVVKGKRRSAGVRCDAKIILPIENVDAPEEWKPVHEDFSDGLAVVQEAAGKDESQFSLTCIHVHPKWIEACDGYRVIRYRMRTGISQPTLIRKESLKHIVGMGMTDFSETPSWIHFRNKADLIFSCRRFMEEYPDLTTFLQMTGEKADLPKGLKEAAERAEVFTEKSMDDNVITVTLTAEKVAIHGLGPQGWYKESKKLKYDGPEYQFLIGPKMLGEIAKKYNTVEVSGEKLKVDGGKWKYVAILGPVQAKTEEGEQEEES